VTARRAAAGLLGALLGLAARNAVVSVVGPWTGVWLSAGPVHLAAFHDARRHALVLSAWPRRGASLPSASLEWNYP
jgi:hypothetical protein